MNSLPCGDGETSSPSPRPVQSRSSPAHLSSPARTRSPGTSPARKRMKLDLAGLSPTSRKKRLCEHRMTRLRHVSTSCREELTELYFINTRSNVIDLPIFRKKPNQQFVNFLKAEHAPARVISEVQTSVLGSALQPLEVPKRQHTYSPRLASLPPVKVGLHQEVYSVRCTTVSKPSPSLPPPTAPVYSTQQVQEKMKQEGWVIRRVSELAKDGLWPAKRLPKVVEQPRPVAAWDLVLEEMKWLAADFQQERVWKQSAARVQARAVSDFVANRNAQKEREAEELREKITQKKIACSIAEQVKLFWGHVSSLYEYERIRRRTIFNTNLLSYQLSHVSQEEDDDERNPSRKRKIVELEDTNTPADYTPSSENGFGSDDESTISEQEAYELVNCVCENELGELEADAAAELSNLLRDNYPGVLTEYMEDDEDEGEDVDMEDSDLEHSESHRLLSIDCLLENIEETEKVNGDLNRKDLIEISQIAESYLPKSVINCNRTIANPKLFAGRLREYQLVALDWLVTMFREKLPAILADEPGLGRRVVTSAFISHLVCEGGAPGPHLILSPASSIHRWQTTLTNYCPGLRVFTHSGSMSDRRRLKQELLEEEFPPHIVVASYIAFYRDSDWLTRRRWGLAVLAEAQNVVAAGSPDQIFALSEVRSDRRLLILSGPSKENPIDLWNLVYLLFPVTYQLHSEPLAVVEGTSEYSNTVNKLQKIVTSFRLARSRGKYPILEKQIPAVNTVPTFVSLTSKQRRLYDDFLAKPDTQDLLKSGDLSSVSNVMRQLRSICNHPSLVSHAPSFSTPTLPTWSRLNPRPARRVEKLVASSPLDSVSLENMNLVFLKQELTTTVLTSARLRSIKASRELIQELPPTTAQPNIPTGKVVFTLEGITRTLNGWNIPGGWVEGMGLVRAATGQVFKVCANQVRKTESTTVLSFAAPVRSNLGANPGSVSSIAEINHWRCSGYPLYGHDLIGSLEITNSVRPARSRFSGQGFINCLTAMSPGRRDERDDWRYTTTLLEPLVMVGMERTTDIQKSLDRIQRPIRDLSIHSTKLQALERILRDRERMKERVILLTSSSDIVHFIQLFASARAIKYLVVCGEESLVSQQASLERFRLENRFFMLVLAGIYSFAGLNVPEVGTVVEYDWSPLHSNLSSRMFGWSPNTIFRLLCRGTVEESMERRNLQRRILADLEAGLSSTLKKQTIEDLFNPQGNDNGFLWTEKKKKDKLKEELEERAAISQLFSVLGVGYEGSGVRGGYEGYEPACLLDLAELDTMEVDEEESGRDADLMAWLETVSPIHRYGMKQMTECAELRAGEDWKLSPSPVDQMEAKTKLESEIQSKAEQKLREEEQMEFVTYPSFLTERDWRDEEGTLTIWKPPGFFEETEDMCTGLLYKKEQMEESELPAVYVKKETKRDLPGSDTVNQSISSPVSGIPLSPSEIKPKIKREDNHLATAPKSLFDRPKPFKTIARPRPGGPLNPVAFGSQNLSAGLARDGIKTVVREGVDSGPDWLIQEDWALHQAVLSLQEMPLTLSANSPAHISNWDMVADMVNAVSKCFRSPRQCRNRYESTVQPREEGKILYNDITPTKKPKKTKLNLKQPEKKSLSKPMKTSVLFKQDNNNAWSAQFSTRFETIKAIANKRTPTTKPLLVNSTQRNPKHASVLAEFSVSYDTPLSPVQVAANRAERILREKQRTAQLAAHQPAAAQQSVQIGQPVRVSVANVSATNPVASSAGNINTPAQAVVVGISQPLQQQQGQIVAVSQINNSNRQLVSNQAAVSVSGVLSRIQTSSTLTTLAGGQIVVSQAGKSAAVGVQGGTLQLGGRSLTQAQLNVLKTQALLKRQEQKQEQQQQLRAKQLMQQQQQNNIVAVSSGSIITVSSAALTAGRTVTATASSAGVGRGQIVRPTNVRSMTEPELKAMLAKQQLKVTGPGVVQVQPGASLSTAQLQQLGIQVATPGSSAALVKAGGNASVAGKSVTIPIAGVNLHGGLKAVTSGRGTVVTNQQNVQQIQQLRQLMMRKGGVQQKVALQQVGGKLPAQLIVQGQQGKGLPATVTVQQLQQIVKSVAGSGQGQVQIGTVAGTGQQIISHAVLTKPGVGGAQTVQARVIPVSGTGGRGQPTIQVVAAAPSGARGNVPNVTLDALSRQQGGAASALASALAAGNHVKIAAPGGATQQQILSQVTAALAGQAGQPVSVAVRTPANVSTVAQQTSNLAARPMQSHQQQQIVNLQLNPGASNPSSNPASSSEST